MNKNRRNKNRLTAASLKAACAPPCPNCGEKGKHWLGVPMTLLDLVENTEPQGFWICPKYYHPETGRRIGT